MARSPFKQMDITRALRAARAAGMIIQRVELDPATGKITITANSAGSPAETTDLDTWMAKNARQA